MWKRTEAWIVLAVLVVGIPTLWMPMGLDHGNCGYVADVILHGGAPYKDAWETRPPAIFYLNAAAIAAFGKNGFAFRMFDLVWQLAAALALGRLARRWFGERAGMFAGVLFAVVYFIPASYWDLANGDIYIVLPSALALLCLFDRPGPRFAWDALGGALIGFVFWVRFTHGLFGLPALAWILSERRHEVPYGFARRIARLTAVGAGFAAVVGGYVALLAAQGAL
ncbi:MAG: glycosyltransferase family 39 protein, partial [Deltaproteobacteria bacterium]|nr:glycosyltransferase family 39 protein [Deltaproteobacteria bacterium]